MNSLLKVLLLTTQKTAILQLNKSANNILLANRRNKNNEKLKRQLINFMSVFLFLFLFLHNAACIANEPPPAEPKLPWSVFPLDSVKWEYIKKRSGAFADLGTVYFDTLTYSVRQISENKAEVYFSSKTAIFKRVDGKYIFDRNGKSGDTEFYGYIILEDKKVYYQDRDSFFFPKTLLYDFNLKLNDTFIYGATGGEKCIVSSIDSVLIFNGNEYEYRKRYNFSGHKHFYWFDYSDYFYVIEGIGCNLEFLYTTHWWAQMEEAIICPEIRKVYYKDKVIWENPAPRFLNLWEGE